MSLSQGGDSNENGDVELDLLADSHDSPSALYFWHEGGGQSPMAGFYLRKLCLLPPDGLHTAVTFCLFLVMMGGGRCSDLFWGAEASVSFL